VANTLWLFHNGAVDFIDWLGCCCKSSRTRWGLHFKGADVDTTIDNAPKAWPMLVVERRRSKARVSCINRRAASKQGMGLSRTTVVL
jgi:hypothetical protein